MRLLVLLLVKILLKLGHSYAFFTEITTNPMVGNFQQYLCFAIYISVSIYLSIYLSVCLPAVLCACLSVYARTSVSTYLLPIYLI